MGLVTPGLNEKKMFGESEYVFLSVLSLFSSVHQTYKYKQLPLVLITNFGHAKDRATVEPICIHTNFTKFSFSIVMWTVCLSLLIMTIKLNQVSSIKTMKNIFQVKIRCKCSNLSIASVDSW